MNKYIWPIIGLNLVLLLIYINHAIMTKEELLHKGQLVLLELAPVDPRSLMQGDFMRLSYGISQTNESSSDYGKRGFIVVKLDENNIARRIRLQPYTVPLLADESIINYTKSQSGGLNIGAESYFFEEGKGQKFENAKYGGLRIDKTGQSLLEGLYDKNRKRID